MSFGGSELLREVNILDYVHISNIKQVNVRHDVDTYVIQISCMVHINLLLKVCAQRDF